MSSTKTPNLLLLPGLLNDARLWKRQVDDLAKSVHCTVAGLTGADTMAALAASVLKQAPPGPFALAGLSMGGYTALEIMRQAPERVTALALLDTSARPDTPQATEGRREMMRLAGSDFTAVVKAMLPKMMHPLHLQDAARTELFFDMAMNVGVDGYLRQQMAIMSRIDSRPWLRRITCPVLILCGREDAVTPVEVHEEMAAEIPGARLTIVEECGHLSAISQPERVTEAMRKWLKGIAGSDE